MIEIRAKRVYLPASPGDGLRVLIDRVWPRGKSKEQVQADLWLKELAPTTALRKWFAHDRSRWVGFRQRYFAELDANPAGVAKLLEIPANAPLTLLYSARDMECNQAVALRDYLLARFNQSSRSPKA
ncbi:MAG: hypothetical protein C0631_04670 [Sedimenticola sp.]|nr:MAG: hypothetical protein C0631_04670 [Sedimenticola sp.]